jgi:hypothetical protein
MGLLRKGSMDALTWNEIAGQSHESAISWLGELCSTFDPGREMGCADIEVVWRIVDPCCWSFCSRCCVPRVVKGWQKKVDGHSFFRAACCTLIGSIERIPTPTEPQIATSTSIAPSRFPRVVGKYEYLTLRTPLSLRPNWFEKRIGFTSFL